MTTQNFSYALFELAGLIGALLVLYSLGAARTIVTKRFLALLLILHTAWLCWDYLAVHLNVYRYPTQGNIPIRAFGLPLEEHLFFPFHILFTWAVVVVVEAAKPPRT